MGSCPVCGCKTDALDYVQKSFGEKDVDICSFCHRQLKGFEGGSVPTEAQKRWLVAVFEKDVAERDEAVLSALKELKGKFVPEEKPQEIPTVKSEGAVQAAAAKPAAKRPDEESAVEVLTKRVAALEAELRAMKRRQMIKTIIELGLPFVMLILLIIIFFATGLADGIAEFFDILESDFM